MVQKNKLDRLVKNANYTDPITMTKVSKDDAVYLKPNASNGKIRHVYHRSTLERIKGTNRTGRSPMSRTTFTAQDIRPAPITGRLHPDLKNKKVQMVFQDDDTIKYTYPVIRPGSRIDYFMDGPNNSLTIYKKKAGSSGNRYYQVNVALQLEAKGDKGVENILRSMVDMVGQSTDIISVTGTRVVKVD